jgi:hypothetical protein
MAGPALAARRETDIGRAVAAATRILGRVGMPDQD